MTYSKRKRRIICVRSNLWYASPAIGLVLVAMACAHAAVAPTVRGKIIYRDVFPGRAAAALTGTKPTIDVTGASWIYNGNGDRPGDDWRANGSAPAHSGFGTLDYLPLKVKGGRIYSLSCVLSPRPGETGKWFALGFFDHTRFYYSSTEGPWMTLTDTAGWAAYAGSGQRRSNHIRHSNSHSVPLGKTARIILNTTGKHWTVQWFYDGRLLARHTYQVNPSHIGGVGIAVYNGQQGHVANFELRVLRTSRKQQH